MYQIRTLETNKKKKKRKWVAPPAGNILIELDKDKVANERTNERTNDRSNVQTDDEWMIGGWLSGWINVLLFVVRRGELTYYIIAYYKCVVGGWA